MTLRFTVPGKTRNTSNLREHPMARAKRVKAERQKAMTLCPKWQDGPLLVVTLWRFGPRVLDSDGLQSALKATRDGVASRLRIDDGSPLVRWEYRQDSCPFGKERVEVVVERTGLMDSLRDFMAKEGSQFVHTGPPAVLDARGGGFIQGQRHVGPTPASYPRKKP